MKYLQINVEMLQKNLIGFCPGDLKEGEITIEDEKCDNTDLCQECRAKFYKKYAVEKNPITSTRPEYNDNEILCPKPSLEFLNLKRVKNEIK